MEDYPNSEPKSKNQYNDSLGYLGRINLIWYKIASSRIAVKPHAWLNYLIAQYLELSTQMDKEERPEFLKQIEDIKQSLNNPFISHGAQSFLKQEIYDKLMQLEQGLRDIWNRAGLDMKTGESETDFSEYI